jgi:serine/threonine protein kinase
MLVTGKYRLDARLGGGGMAEVFLGSTVGAEGFSRKVAIKRVLPGFSDNPAFAQMFVAEAQISSRLVHPNIVSVLDFDRDAEQRLFLVMELVEGSDLDTLCASGLLPFPVVIHLVAEILRGLGYAHDLPVGADVRGVVHRDVSPHNVLLSWEGAVKVSDFGIAKARAASNATASVFIKGKPAYMSPEQANGQALDGRSDLFAVGVMLWEMLVGRRLFTGEDTRATLAAVLFGVIPRPRSLRADVPKDVERVAMKLLERDLPARYATAEKAIKDLLDCAEAAKDARELLVKTLAERFPQHAPVRQSSLVRGKPVAERATVPDGSAGRPPAVAALPSVGAVRAASTNTLPLPPTSRGKMLLVVVAALAVGVATFGVVYLATKDRRGGKTATTEVTDARGSGRLLDVVAAAAPPHDAAAPPDAPVAPAAPPIDAGAPPDAAKRDVTPPHVEKRYGKLAVHAFPVATVYVDRRRIGDTPQTIDLLVGPHVLRLANPDRNYEETIPITITENRTLEITK